MGVISFIKNIATDPDTRLDVMNRLPRLVSDRAYVKKLYLYKTGKRLNLKKPQTFNEKIQWLKLYDRNPLYTRLADKYAVREYIAERIGNGYSIPLLGVWDSFDDIDFSLLPDKFVLKCTHDCDSVII